jgi:hypothetical protein
MDTAGTGRWKCCREHRGIVRSTLSCMNLVAKILLWCSAMASVAAVVWYTNELRINGYVLLYELLYHLSV